ncbi:hypothetical protein [Paraburkholderia sp. J67]|uniref:hypothetical protein n=1 Tax=Paraburkholderia sp. J67 TaxID=2805435 RepID=UPI002ABDF293|nr:hypothetical protein [Paraburkholderia sp. J67]
MAFDHSNGKPSWRSRCNVLAFFVCFFLLMSSGRIGSGDAGQQLSATMLAVTQGQLGTNDPPMTHYWVPSPNGKVYEPHDIGAIALMLPSAWLGAKLSHASPDEMFRNPPLIAKVSVSLTYAIVCAFGCLYLFLLFAASYSVREAFLLSFTFAAGTYFLPYAKVCWDVAPCAAATCAFLYYVQRLLRPQATLRTFIAAGLSLSVVAAFRYSFAPGMAAGLVILFWRTRGPFVRYVALGAAFVVGLTPTFIYNAVRTGSILRPATATDFYLTTGTALHGDIPTGLVGLLISPNRGFFVYSPILLLGLFLPLVWKTLREGEKRMIEAMLPGSLVYVLIIAKMNYWGAFGWGARYMLPVLPVAMLALAPCLIAVARRSSGAAAALVLAAMLFNVPTALTNWHAVVAEFPGAILQDNPQPKLLEGIWQGFEQGVRGEPTIFANSAPEALHDNARRFPDLWTFRLMDHSDTGRVLGWMLLVMFACGLAVTSRTIIATRRQKGDGASHQLATDI